MLYRFVINFLRLKLLEFLLAKLFGRQFSRINALKVMSPKAYLLEWLTVNLNKSKKKQK